MNVQRTRDQGTLQMKIAGRVDSAAAPRLEAEIRESLEGVTELTLDFSEVEYISSAGLRVLLAAQKKMASQGSLTVSHVSEDVMAIFDVTGFSGILNISD